MTSKTIANGILRAVFILAGVFILLLLVMILFRKALIQRPLANLLAAELVEEIEEMEHSLRRGLYLRANFDFDYEEFEITPGTMEAFDRKGVLYVGDRSGTIRASPRT